MTVIQGYVGGGVTDYAEIAHHQLPGWARIWAHATGGRPGRLGRGGARRARGHDDEEGEQTEGAEPTPSHSR